MNNLQTTIGDICDIKTGKKDVNAEKADGIYPFFTCAQDIHKIDTYTFDDEAVLVAGNGFFNVKYYQGKFDAYQRTYVLHKFKESVRAKYVYYYIQRKLNEITKDNRGSTIRYIRLGDLADQSILLPTLEIQDKAIGLLDQSLVKVSTSATAINAAKTKLNQFRQSILSAAVTGKLTEDWRINNQNINADSLINRLETERKLYQKKEASEIAEPELPEIPSSWKWVSVDSLSRHVVDGVHKTPNYQEAGIPFITVKNLTAGKGISFDDTKFITVEDHKSFTSRAKPEKGDILISKDGTLGVTRAIRTDREFSIFVSVAMIKPLLYEMTDYLELALSSQELQGQMVGVGTGLVHLVLRDLKADGVPLPPLEEQKEIVKRVNKYFDLADKVEYQIANAEAKVSKLTQAVLAKTFSSND